MNKKKKVSELSRDFKFEFVTEAPLEEIINLYKEGNWWKESPTFRAQVPKIITGSFAFILVRDSAKKIIGMGRVISDGISDGYIQDLILYKEYRGLGLGQEMVRLLTKYCQDRGVWWVGLIAEPGTTGFYESMGFVALTDHMAMLHKDS